MNATTMLFILLAVAAGVINPFQSAVNAQLGRSLDSALSATLVVFVTGAVALVAITLLGPEPIPSIKQLVSAPRWTYWGGLLGIAYIALVVICVQKLGIGSVTISILLGQVVAALIIDQFGLLGAEMHPITLVRVAGVVLTVVGVVIVQTN